MGIRQDVKSGKMSVDEALNKLKACDFVTSDIVPWLQRRKGVVIETVIERPQPKKNKKNKR